MNSSVVANFGCLSFRFPDNETDCFNAVFMENFLTRMTKETKKKTEQCLTATDVKWSLLMWSQQYKVFVNINQSLLNAWAIGYR